MSIKLTNIEDKRGIQIIRKSTCKNFDVPRFMKLYPGYIPSRGMSLILNVDDYGNMLWEYFREKIYAAEREAFQTGDFKNPSGFLNHAIQETRERFSHVMLTYD